MERDWEYRLSQAMDEVTKDLGVTKAAFARALGFGSYLSLSDLSGPHREARFSRLCAALRAPNLPLVVSRLSLPVERYPRLEAFFKEAVRLTLSWDIDPVSSRGSLRECIDFGVAGVELFDAARWDEALPYLDRSWAAFQKMPLDTDLEIITKLRVGTQIVSLDGYMGQTDRTRRMVQEMLILARRQLQTKQSHPEMLLAIGRFYIGAAISYRLFGTLASRDVAGYSKVAFDVLASRNMDVAGQIAALRDQAKPLIRHALLGSRDAESLTAEALAALHRADNLAGGKCAKDGLEDAWLFTRGTLVDCLSVLGLADEAERVWDETMAAPWVGKHIEERKKTPLKSKVEVSRMALLAARLDLDELGRLAEAFQTDPANRRYINRLEKVALLGLFAESNDRQRLYDALLG